MVEAVQARADRLIREAAAKVGLDLSLAPAAAPADEQPAPPAPTPAAPTAQDLELIVERPSAADEMPGGAPLSPESQPPKNRRTGER